MPPDSLHTLECTFERVLNALCKTRERTHPRYVCGQRVWLSTRNIPLQSPSRKLAPKFIGPFPIVKDLSPVVVRLRLPRFLQRVHPVYHVLCIKPIIRLPSHLSWAPLGTFLSISCASILDSAVCCPGTCPLFTLIDLSISLCEFLDVLPDYCASLPVSQ